MVEYVETLTKHYNDGIRRKMGLKTYDREIAAGLLKEMYEDSTDYTNTFRALSSLSIKTPETGFDGDLSEEFRSAIGAEFMSEERVEAWSSWVQKYRVLLQKQGWESENERLTVQNNANPAIIPRNHVLVDIISEVEVGNYDPLMKYMNALLKPYDGEGLQAGWLVPAPLKSRLGVELLSCSS